MQRSNCAVWCRLVHVDALADYGCAEATCIANYGTLLRFSHTPANSGKRSLPGGCPSGGKCGLTGVICLRRGRLGHHRRNHHLFHHRNHPDHHRGCLYCPLDHRNHLCCHHDRHQHLPGRHVSSGAWLH